MRKIVAKSNNIHPKNEGLFIYNHALFMNEKDSSYKITNIIHRAKPFSKLFTTIQEKVAITGTQSLSYSAELLASGATPDGITQISLGIGDIKFTLERSDTDYMISFTGDSLTSKEISLTCKLIAGNIVKIFNPLKGTSDIRFSGNSKIEIISRGTYTAKQEIFINDTNKQLMLITEKLF